MIEDFFSTFIDIRKNPPLEEVKKLELNSLNCKTHEQVLNKVRTIIRARKRKV